MITLFTDKTIDLSSTHYDVRTETGQILGSYTQRHRDDTVTSEQLSAEDQGVVGAIEAIVIIAHASDVRGFKLSEDGNTKIGAELEAEVHRRIAALGGQSKIHVSHLGEWAYEIGICPSDIVRVIQDEESKDLVTV